MRNLFAILLLFVWSGVASAKGPNVILFYADDLGIGDVSCYGCTDIQTVHIDALARTGIRFTHYYSAAPVCSPSRAALLTGRYPARAGVPSNVSSSPGHSGMPTEEVTLAELAQTRGYATALIGKWHLGFTYETQPNAQGFDFFFGHHAGCVDYYSHMFYWQTPHHHDLYRNRQEIHEEGQYMTDLIAREVTQFIDDHQAEPFLLYVPFNAPHYPLQAPERFRRMYAHLPQKRRDYAPLVGAMDDAIGKIMARVRHHHLTPNTLVFFMSDNGISVEGRNNGGGGSSGPFRDHKFSLFEGGIHMPGIVSWPGQIPQGQIRDQLTMATDVFSTLAEAIGADVSKDRIIDGRSWWPLLRDARAKGHEMLFWEWNKQSAVRAGKWKVTRNALMTPGMDEYVRAKGDDAIFLADLEADPGETTNLRHQHPQIAKQLLKQHADWLKTIEPRSPSR